MIEDRERRTTKSEPSTEVRVRGAITLGQLLKFSGAADSGGQAKSFVDDGEVLVNGEVERRRGRQLQQGDVVEVSGARMVVIRADGVGREKDRRNAE